MGNILTGLLGYLGQDAQKGQPGRRGLLDFINDPSGEQAMERQMRQQQMDLMQQQMQQQRAKQSMMATNFGGYDPLANQEGGGIIWNTGRQGSAGENLLSSLPESAQPVMRGLLQVDPEKAMGLLADGMKPAQQTDDQREYALAQQQGFKGTFLDYVGEKAAKGRAPADPYSNLRTVGNTIVDLSGGTPKPLYTSPRDEGESRASAEAGRLRNEYIGQSKPFLQAREAFGRVEAAASDESGAGDLALVYGFMKMLDPTSVVREGEFATAENAGGVPERIVATYNKVLNGERLAPAVRKQFFNQAQTQFRQVGKQYDTLRNTYGDLADKLGLDRGLVVVDLAAPEGPPPANMAPKPQAASGGAAPTAAPDGMEKTYQGKKYRKIRGQWYEASN